MSMDKKIEKKKGPKPKHYLMIVGVIALGFLVYLSIQAAGESVYRAEKEKLSISEVSKGEFIEYITLIGNVEPITTIHMDLQEGGRVEEILIEEGEMVKEGDVILRLSNHNLTTTILNQESRLAYEQNDIQRTQINLEQTRISNKQQLLSVDKQLTQYKRKYEQNKILFDKELVAKELYLQSKEDYELAMRNRELRLEKLIYDSIFREKKKEQMEQSLKSQQLTLQLVKQRLENLSVRAPADGQLGSLNAEIGQSLGSGQQIGLLHVLDAFKVVAPVDEHYIDRVKKGLNGIVDRQDVPFELIIKKVYPEVRGGSFEIDLVFTETEPENLRTGQSYYIKLELGESLTATLLPRGGFFQSTGGQWAYVLDPSESFAIKRNIRIGRQNPQFYEVIEGLQTGEKVITSNYDVFGNNDKIMFK